MNSKAGVTLVEVMVAIIIFTIVMVGGFVFFFYGRSYIAHSNHQRMALELTKEKIEICKAFGYDSVVLDPGTGVLLGGIQFTRSVAVNETSLNGTYKTVTVTTSWQERGNNYDVKLVTIIAQD
ncbi:MAG: prepilin-type N-terminal cleavage/methylation domain-containing protein [Candidatus Ratteibacteria bacterium]|nr:prepilin-type N-terminal cleavage/methylation domain-containing protein [Candidatus Ratteibacteria bacterium]